MTERNRIKTVLTLAAVAMAVIATSASAATMSASLTAPTVDAEDIANYTGTSLDKWFCYVGEHASKVAGQTLTTGSDNVMLNAITYQALGTTPTKTYTIRVCTVDRVNPGDSSTWVLTEIYSETATQDFAWNSDDYVTWTLDTPLLLSPNTEYGIDVGMNSTTSSWQEGIPYLRYTGTDEYAGGTRYWSGQQAPGNTDPGGVGDSTMSNVSGERVFHLDLEHPMSPSPQSGATVPAGDVELSWTNLNPNVGDTVYVDVWFGTDPCSLTQVVTAGVDGTNITSKTVSAPVADTYYWQVDSYLEGSPTGDPIEGSLFIFYVDDTDGDGLPDTYELANTSPPSPTALNPGDDLEPDGLTNLQEYQIGTNPIVADTDGDTLEDGAEVAGAGARPATDPLLADTDEDGLDDAAETNTGTYVSATDTGTDPTDVDSDADGLDDGVETNTGVFVDDTDTGTDPTAADSDGDGAGDWYEVAATYTDPTNPGDNPGIPYPLPDPDSTPPDTAKPVKVYILSGQSNMVGMGNIAGTPSGTLETIAKRENKFPNLVDASGAWTVRNDVMYRGVVTAIGNGPLTPGVQGGTIGPEMGFGHVMGYYHDEPVIVLKSSQGNRSISWDFAPPSSERFIDGDYTYAGYGDSPNRWLTGEPNIPIAWYAGKQWDDCFMDESDWAPAGGDPIFNVTDVLDNFASEYPQYAGQGFEIAGFAWWQGHKDQGEPHASRYELNMVNFINDLRQYYENRYPDNISPNAPFVLATIAFGGWDLAGAGLTVANGQLAVSGETGNYPEFAGNVKTMEARGYWRSVEESPVNQGYHYNRNAETFMLVGDALGRGMVEMMLPLMTISGNAGLAGVVMSGLPGNPVSSEGGIYSGFVQEGWSGTVTPTLAGYLFTPPSITYTDVTTDQLNQDYTVHSLIGDINLDGKITLVDYSQLASPGQASNPHPADGATDIDINADLSWTAGSRAPSHDVYFGTTNPPPFIRNQTAAIFDPGTMTISTTYYWRIDEVGPYGSKTTGTVWSFTTELGPPPL